MHFVQLQLICDGTSDVFMVSRQQNGLYAKLAQGFQHGQTFAPHRVGKRHKSGKCPTYRDVNHSAALRQEAFGFLLCFCRDGNTVFREKFKISGEYLRALHDGGYALAGEHLKLFTHREFPGMFLPITT